MLWDADFAWKIFAQAVLCWLLWTIRSVYTEVLVEDA